MSNIDVYNQVDAVLKRLYGFTEKRQIDALFDEENITDYNERVKLLHKCMELKTFIAPLKKYLQKMSMILLALYLRRGHGEC